MEITLPLSSSSFLKHHGSNKVRALCRSMVSQVVFQVLFVFFIFESGVVGFTLGAVAGAMVGWKNKMRFLQDVTLGAIWGAVLSCKVAKATFDYFLYTDDFDGDGCLLHLLKIVARELEASLRRPTKCC